MAKQQLHKGQNDLETLYPVIAAEWDYDNNDCFPSEITFNSTKKVSWICPKGHHWSTQVRRRTLDGVSCLYCSNQLVYSGYNDLESINPNLAKEWNYEKNDGILPSMVSPNTAKKYWWKCSVCGYEWKADTHSRNAGKGCPMCAKRKQSSFPEQAVFFYLKKEFPDSINSYRIVSGSRKELDIYIPSIMVGIEYDGKPWHSRKDAVERDKQKYDLCNKLGIQVIRILEGTVSKKPDNCDFFILTDETCSSSSLTSVFDSLGRILGKKLEIDINLDKDTPAILGQYMFKLDEKTLSASYPYLAKEWDYSKNYPLTPEKTYANSNVKVWWLCKEGHSWQASIDNRVKGNGCPYCSGRFAIKGKTDLATNFPQLMSEWDYEKNEKAPELYTVKSNKKVWWRCAEGHSWESVISSRTSGSGCPYCAGRKVLPGYNDLQSLLPNIAEEWSDKNGNLAPCDFTTGSNKRVWWKCKKCGYEWQAQICNRANGTGCPACAKKKNAGSFGNIN